MTNIYTWSITGLFVAPSLDGLSQVVAGVNLKLDATDGQEPPRTAMDRTAVIVPAPVSGDFTPFDKLTEAAVMKWVEALPGWAAIAAAVQAKCDAAISAQQSPSTPVPMPLPWEETTK